MSMTNPSLTAEYFERMFAGNGDPWGFETSAYELAKFNATIAALDTRRYESALEIGCAIGVLTRRLATCCDVLISLDVSETALASARLRNADSSHVAFYKMVFPSETPDGRFDLIVLSEVVYYWSDADIQAAGAWIAGHLMSSGDILLVHWTGETDYPQTADDAMRKLRSALPDLSVIKQDTHENYRLDVWRIP